ncbi:MAG: ethanolamine utilization protein [Betaproteobacteria bacterium]|nr:ethanolamine utilization protein [Betaproteobacteria bacterium]
MLPPLAFVDLETSGLSPRADRVTEIGVVTVDDGQAVEWTTLINPGRSLDDGTRCYNGIDDNAVAAAPRFREIAADLHALLKGRIFIAHNARFDFGFLRAEFARFGIDFEAQVLCTVMLSRKLHPDLAGHDLDTLMQRHALPPAIRHRALPDARLVWQFWQLMHAQFPASDLSTVIDELLAGPVLPAHLDPSLIDRLPEQPGVYVLQGDGGAPLHVGKAANLRRHLIEYFRLDRRSAKAAAVSHLVRNITWRVTRGAIGSHLQRIALAEEEHTAKVAPPCYTWRLRPSAHPCVALVDFGVDAQSSDECFGLYDSPRKARNALLRLSREHGLCHALLGIAGDDYPCTRCAAEMATPCIRKTDRLRHLTRALTALRPLRLAQWPYGGPIAVKEHSDLHVIDEWRYLGTAHSEHEIHDVMQTRARYFDRDTFEFLARTLRRLPGRRIKRLDYANADAVTREDHGHA